MPAAVNERLSAEVRERIEERYRWLKERSSGLPETCPVITSIDSPTSLLCAYRERVFFLGVNVRRTFWNESENIVVCLSACSKSFRKRCQVKVGL